MVYTALLWPDGWLQNNTEIALWIRVSVELKRTGNKRRTSLYNHSVCAVELFSLKTQRLFFKYMYGKCDLFERSQSIINLTVSSLVCLYVKYSWVLGRGYLLYTLFDMKSQDKKFLEAARHIKSMFVIYEKKILKKKIKLIIKIISYFTLTF